MVDSVVEAAKKKAKEIEAKKAAKAKALADKAKADEKLRLKQGKNQAKLDKANIKNKNREQKGRGKNTNKYGQDTKTQKDRDNALKDKKNQRIHDTVRATVATFGSTSIAKTSANAASPESNMNHYFGTGGTSNGGKNNKPDQGQSSGSLT